MARTRFDPTTGREVKHDARTFHAGTAYGARQEQLATDRGFMGKHGLFKNAVLPTAAFVAAPLAAGAIGGGAGAATLPAAATQGVGYSSAAGGGMTFGNLLKIGELGTGVVTNVIGQRQQNRALERDAALRSQEFAQQMALTQQAQAQAQRQWEAEQAQRAQEYALAMADRDRRIRLEDEREARRAPYRALSQQALRRFGDLLRLGRG